MNNTEAIAATRHWLEKVVVGYNFCPFAKPVVEQDKIRYQVLDTTQTAEQLKTIANEIEWLDSHAKTETSLLIIPQGVEDFEDYLDLLDMANGLILEMGLQGTFQFASFHPDYCFEGESADDAANFTNRSPLPLLHLLRESSIERAIRYHPDPGIIPETNIKKARQLGNATFRQILAECFTEPDD